MRSKFAAVTVAVAVATTATATPATPCSKIRSECWRKRLRAASSTSSSSKAACARETASHPEWPILARTVTLYRSIFTREHPLILTNKLRTQGWLLCHTVTTEIDDDDNDDDDDDDEELLIL
ncbi:hypothetical protein V1477_000614 [Vespula maculifrons]|uniref:Secreted protein n=1 Tax=Vespula maculifrons TaxID=7453 RepID=A0ABD2D2A7_VESMC